MSIDHPGYRRLTRAHNPDWTEIQAAAERGSLSPATTRLLIGLERRGELERFIDRMKQPVRDPGPGGCSVSILII